MTPPAGAPGRRTAELAVLLALLGLAVSNVLLREHLTVFQGDVAGGLFCGQAGRFDCNAVAAHRSAWLIGFPLPFWGILFYLTMAVLALDARVLPPGQSAAAAAAGAVLALAAVVFDVYLGVVMLTQIGAVCLNCVSTYVINLLLAVLFWRLDRAGPVPRDWRAYLLDWRPPSLPAQPERPSPEAPGEPAATEGGLAGVPPLAPSPAVAPSAAVVPSRASAWKVGSIFVALCGAVVALVLTSRSIHETLGDAQVEAIEFMQRYTTEPAIDMHRFDGLPSLGPPGARVTIAVASDFQCSFCRALAARLEQLRAEYPHDVRVIFVNAPISSKCNPAIKRDTHEHACWLALAGICANEHGKFWEYHDLVYREIPPAQVNEKTVLAKISRLGIDPNALATCTRVPQADSVLARDVALFRELQMKSVPSLVINGHVKAGGIYPSTLRAIVEVLVAHK